MRRITISLPSALYAELSEVAAATEEHGYGPSRWANDLIASELAARRLPKVSQGAYGARVPEPELVECPVLLSESKSCIE